MRAWRMVGGEYITRDITVGQLVAGRPGWARIFERLGIDYCCGGKATLGDSCRENGLDVDLVLRELEEAKNTDAGHDGFDAQSMPMAELVEHIVAHHHGYLRRELPRLAGLARQVAAAHRSTHPELDELRDVID